MMSDLQEIHSYELFVGEYFAFRRTLDISRQQKGFSAIGQAHDEGIVVLRGLAFRKVVRPQYIPRNPIFGECVALPQMSDEHTVRSRQRKDLPVRGALNIPSHPQFTDAKILKYRRQ